MYKSVVVQRSVERAMNRMLISFTETDGDQKVLIWGYIMRNIIATCSLVFACNTYATDLEKVDVEKCSYLDGIARETQVIRSATGDSFDEFKLHTD